MSDDRSLVLNDRTKLKWLPKDYKYYLNRTTIVYGRTNSGKSTIMEEIMYLCKDYVPAVFVIAPTNSSNNAYTNKIPPHYIRKELDAPWLEKFLNRQKNVSGAYIIANNLENLKKIFNKIADDVNKDVESSIIKKAHNSISLLENSSMEFAQKKNQKSQIMTEKENMLKKLYKTVIRYNKVKLEQSDSLTGKEKAVLGFLDVNPNVMLILDDCASKFKKMYKKTSAIKEIFYEGRHYFITTIISTQDDKEVDSELRKNTTISIFTTSQSATSNFDRPSNGYPKHERQRAKSCIETIFKQDEIEMKHYQKLVYLQGEADPFRYTISDLYDEFQMGSKHIWNYSEKIKSNKNQLNKNNPLFDIYI